MSPALSFISLVFNAYYIIMLVRVLASWFPDLQRQSWFQIIIALTDPILTPIRNIISRFSGNIGIDFSPIVAFFLIQFVEGLVVNFLHRMGVLAAVKQCNEASPLRQRGFLSGLDRNSRWSGSCQTSAHSVK